MSYYVLDFHSLNEWLNNTPAYTSYSCIPSTAVALVSEIIRFVSNVSYDSINLENLLRIFLEWYFPIYSHQYYYLLNDFL